MIQKIINKLFKRREHCALPKETCDAWNKSNKKEREKQRELDIIKFQNVPEDEKNIKR